MAAFGTGVNPALGRIDYTPYLQGSLQGSAALGRGIASLGESAAGAIKEYTQNKETRDLITQNNENQAQKAMAIAQAFQNNPQLFGGVSPISEKTFTDLKNMPSMSMGKLKALNAELNASITKYEPVLQRFAESENTRMRLNIANQLTGTGMDPLAAALQAGLPADQATSFATGISQRNLAATEAAKNLAATVARPTSEKQTKFDTIVNTLIEEAIAKNNGLPLTPKQYSDIVTNAAKIEGGNTSDPAAIQYYAKEGDWLSQKAAQASNVLPNIAKAQELLQTTQTGFGTDLKEKFRSAAKSFGFPVNEQELNNIQLLRSTFGNFLLNIIQQTKGSTSDKETFLFQSMSAGLDKTPEANKDIIDLYASVAKRDIDAKRAFDDTLEKTGDWSQAFRASRSVINQFDNSYMKKIDDLSQKYVNKQTSNIPPSIAAPQQGNGFNLTNLNDRLNVLNQGLRPSGANSNR